MSEKKWPPKFRIETKTDYFWEKFFCSVCKKHLGKEYKWIYLNEWAPDQFFFFTHCCSDECAEVTILRNI